jgi:hypothetical protein
MSSGGSNYNGTQPTNTAYVKNFVNGSFPDAWKYTMIDDVSYLTMSSSTNSLYLFNDLNVEKDLYVDGVIYNPSDAILKTDIKDISKLEVDALMSLTPKTFHFVKEGVKSDRRHYGVVAQQVEQVLPDLVKQTETPDGPHKSVNYIELIPLMLSKMQDMQAQIDRLKNDLRRANNRPL